MLLIVITALDYITGPSLNLSVVYFLPITYAAWSLGRVPGSVVALFAETPTYLDQIDLVRAGDLTKMQGISSSIVRLLVYLFVAEVTFRLAQSSEDNRQAAEEMRRLNEDLQRTHARIDEDARAGGLLQSSLLAVTPPSALGCNVGARVKYAQQVGGDFADAGILGGVVYACVGDISGKGTPAALFTALVKHLLDDAHRRGLMGGATIAALNSALCDSLPNDRFVTLFYAEIDPSTGDVEYVNAGHPEGLVFRADGKFETAESNASLLGCQTLDTPFQPSHLTLNTGDTLVLYTDGAVESKTHDGVQLGYDVIRRLIEDCIHLPAQEMADAIVRRIEEMTEESNRDDLTVVCIKRTP
jgi:serine phosphatase RsbU (regulator of sigma subunit)